MLNMSYSWQTLKENCALKWLMYENIFFNGLLKKISFYSPSSRSFLDVVLFSCVLKISGCEITNKEIISFCLICFVSEHLTPSKY